MTAVLGARSLKTGPGLAGPRAAPKEKAGRGDPGRLFDLLQLQFCSVTKRYLSSVTLSSDLYRSGQILFFHPSS
jgi:hypothetical protein